VLAGMGTVVKRASGWSPASCYKRRFNFYTVTVALQKPKISLSRKNPLGALVSIREMLHTVGDVCCHS